MASAPPKPVRSPSYPSISLPDAIAAVRKIEGVYRLSPLDRESAAKFVGYSSLSGPANQALSSLAQYGLVERAGKGEMRVTDRARALLYPDSDSERAHLVLAAAFEPPLFRDMQDRWPNMKPPEDGVISYLNRQGFNQSAIRTAARAYLQTLSYLEEAGVSDSNGPDSAAYPDTPPTPQSSELHVQQPLSNYQPEGLTSPAVTPARSQPDAAKLNRINMNVQGARVHLEALLDRKGIATLKRKLASLEALLEEDEDEFAAPDAEDLDPRD